MLIFFNFLLFKLEKMKMKDSHQGIASFEVSRVEYSDSAYAANVFLQVHYADSTQEQIVVPMVVRDDVWLMR